MFANILMICPRLQGNLRSPVPAAGTWNDLMEYKYGDYK